MPNFAIEGGLLLVLARGASVAALLSVFGTAVFSVLVAPKALARATPEVSARIGAALLAMARLGLLMALASMLAWLVLQAVDMAGAHGLRDVVASVPAVVSGTLFGHLIAAQAALLVAALLAIGCGGGRPGWGAVGLSGAALALQAGHGHALAMGGPGLLLVSDVLHLLAAGAWLGGLLPLLVLVAAAPLKTGAAAARWFSPLGKACVAAMVASAAVQFWELIGGVPGLIGTAYGWVAGAKLTLLVVLLGFAAANRYRLAPALLHPEQPEAARRALVRSVAVQTGFGLLAVLAATTLSELPPAIHEQPVWPFAVRPSLVALADPDLAWEVSRALLLAAAAVALLLLSALWRRGRWPAVAVAVVLFGVATPHFDLLLVEAYPTSYLRSPTGFAADAIARGAQLYPMECAACHGADGKGDGPEAASLGVPPADLTAGHLWEHEDGELFWWLSHGIEAPEGGMAMPGFADRLSANEGWDLIDYIRAHNAGVGMRDAGSWPRPVQAPGFSLACTNGRARTTSDLRGSVLHLVAAEPGGAALPSAPATLGGGVQMVTVLLTRDGTSAPAAEAACAATDPAAWDAYATVAGLPRGALSGTQFLVDPDGWLRAEQRPGEDVFRWADPSALLADARAICAHPIAARKGGGGHVHH